MNTRVANLIAIVIGLAAIAMCVAFDSLLVSGSVWTLLTMLVPIVTPIIVSFWLPTRWFWIWLVLEIIAVWILLAHLHAIGDQSAYEFTTVAIWVNVPFTLARLFLSAMDSDDGYR